MNIALWIVQGLLALIFLAGGAMKLFAYERAKTYGLEHLPRSLVTFIGSAEIAGGIGLILPMALNIVPWLSQVAGVGLAIIMILAVAYNIRQHETPMGPAVLFVLLAFVAISRHHHLAA